MQRPDDHERELTLEWRQPSHHARDLHTSVELVGEQITRRQPEGLCELADVIKFGAIAPLSRWWMVLVETSAASARAS